VQFPASDPRACQGRSGDYVTFLSSPEIPLDKQSFSAWASRGPIPTPGEPLGRCLRSPQEEDPCAQKEGGSRSR